MGSSATEFVGDRLGVSVKVPSYTLSTIAKRTGLSKVDFIKCDVEGAEAVIFEDSAFFDRYRPRIVAQVHRSEEHTSELQSLMRISYAVFCLKKKTTITILKN